MSNLTKITSHQLPKEVSNLSRQVYNANIMTMIREIDDMNIVVNSIHQSINKSIFDKGANLDVDEINILKTTVTEDILSDFNTLTLEDINICFKMGVRGSLGDYFGINAVTYYGWLKKYKTEIIPQVYKEVGNYIKPTLIEEPKVDLKSYDLHKINTIYDAIVLFDKELVYSLNDIGNIHYNFLDSHKCFDKLSENILNTLWEEAKNSLIKDVKSKNYELIKSGKYYHVSDVQKLIQKIEYGEKDTEVMIDITYKKMILKHFISHFHEYYSDLEKFKDDLTDKTHFKYEK